MLRLATGGATTISGGGMGGNRLNNPESTSIVVDTKKKINNKNAMSAVEVALISGVFFLAILSLFYSPLRGNIISFF